MSKFRLTVVAGVITLAIVACAGSASLAETGSDATIAPVTSEEPAVAEAPVATETPAEEPTEEPAEEPAGPQQFAVGEAIEVSGDFISSDLTVRVAKVKEAKKYGDYSKPEKGNVYLAVKYEYEAIEDGATYNPFDWQVFVDGTAVQNYAFVMDGPQPELSSGTLPTGRKAEGWVVYEVPKAGEVVLSYGANMFGGDAPTFEVIARSA